jgi:hypothetical protein
VERELQPDHCQLTCPRQVKPGAQCRQFVDRLRISRSAGRRSGGGYIHGVVPESHCLTDRRRVALNVNRNLAIRWNFTPDRLPAPSRRTGEGHSASRCGEGSS